MTSQSSHTVVIHDCKHKHIYKSTFHVTMNKNKNEISYAHVHECLDDACANEMQMSNAMLNTRVL